MKSLFFYGTLCHLPLLEAVLGRALVQGDVQDAELAGHRIYWVKDQQFPVIVKEAGRAQGILLANLSDEDVARLDFYEGGYGYELRELSVDTPQAGDVGPHAAKVYFPDPGMWEKGADWSLTDWVARWGDMTVLAATEELHYFGRYSPERIAEMFPTIRARAWAKVNATSRNHAHSPGGMGLDHVTEHGRTYPYAGFFAMSDVTLSHKSFAGAELGPMERAVFMATDAVILLPYDPVRDRVLLVEQFRAGAYMRGDEKPWQLEPIAGRIDAGETPQQAAMREAEEEAGLTLRHLEEVAHCYASPGCSTEYFDIYVGLADLPDNITGDAGLDSEQEDIRSYVFSFDELMQMVDKMQTVNAPLVLAALWLARHRDRLRTTS